LHSGQTFRIGRGVKKTNAISAGKPEMVNGIWLFAGEGSLYNDSPSPNEKIARLNFYEKVSLQIMAKFSSP
jgi:hypothetical protein